MSEYIPVSPPRDSTRKKAKKEKKQNGIEYATCMSCGTEFKKKTCSYCIDKECHDDLFHDWITYKYRDDPSMLHVSKSRWRFVLHSEYFQLANFQKYSQMRLDGEVHWPFNIYDRGTIPLCIYTSLERFIQEVYSSQAIKWYKETQKKYDNSTKSEIEKCFTAMMKQRNEELALTNGNKLPEVAKNTKGMATHKIELQYG